MNSLEAIAWRVTGAMNRIVDRARERQLNIRTTGSVEIDQPDAVRYACFAHRSVEKILDGLQLTDDDTFVDIGCGKGRVVCCAARRNVREVVGVEIDSELCRLARQNAEQIRGRCAPIRIVNNPAQDFDYREGTVMFLFNPFGQTTLRAVIESIRRSISAEPRSVRLAYVNPLHERVIADAGGFEPYDRWQRRPWTGLKFDVSFWRSVPHG
jgi:predicted RNA methylase